MLCAGSDGDDSFVFYIFLRPSGAGGLFVSVVHGLRSHYP